MGGIQLQTRRFGRQLAGWNPRSPETGRRGQILPMQGSCRSWRREAERLERRDPRPSIEERYRDRDDYLTRVRAAAEVLARQRYILEEDVEVCVENAARPDAPAATPRPREIRGGSGGRSGERAISGCAGWGQGHRSDSVRGTGTSHVPKSLAVGPSSRLSRRAWRTGAHPGRRPRDGDAWYFLLLNANKRSVSLNLKDERGKEILRELIRQGRLRGELRAGRDRAARLRLRRGPRPEPTHHLRSGQGVRADGPFGSFLSFDMIAQAAAARSRSPASPGRRPSSQAERRRHRHRRASGARGCGRFVPAPGQPGPADRGGDAGVGDQLLPRPATHHAWPRRAGRS